MRAVAVVGSKGKEVTVVERECSASDRLDTRREAEVSWCGGAGPLTVRRRRRGGEHPWALLVVLFACAWQLPSAGAATHEKPPASAVAEQGCFIRKNNGFANYPHQGPTITHLSPPLCADRGTSFSP